MKRATSFAVLLTGLLLSVAATQAAPPFSLLRPSGNQLKWQENLQAAHKVATEQNKPILVVFGADWCHYCKKLERETLNSAEVSKYVNDSFVPVHLDVDKEKRVAEILKVSSLPCSVILSPNADLLGRIEGYHTSAPFVKQLNMARQKHQVVQRTSSIAQ